MDKKIAVDTDTLQIGDDKNENYEWKCKLMKCVTYEITYKVIYAKTQVNTIVS